MTEKIIFLDFDVPVTNRLTALATGSAFELNPLIIRILNNVCAASGAKIVCSSNRAPLGSEVEVNGLLQKSGLNMVHLHDDWTCSYENTYKPDKAEAEAIRTANIRRWLAAHPGVEYVAIDDLPLDLPHFVHITDVNNGVSFENIQQVCALLSIDLNDVTKAANPKAPRFKFPAYKPQ